MTTVTFADGPLVAAGITTKDVEVPGDTFVAIAYVNHHSDGRPPETTWATTKVLWVDVVEALDVTVYVKDPTVTDGSPTYREQPGVWVIIPEAIHHQAGVRLWTPAATYDETIKRWDHINPPVPDSASTPVAEGRSDERPASPAA